MMIDSDVLDEILAYTASVPNKRPEPLPNPTPLTVQPADLAPANLVNPQMQFLAPTFAPSPRGIQDDFTTFPILTQTNLAGKGQLVCYGPNQQEDPAVAVAAAMGGCIQNGNPGGVDTVQVAPVNVQGGVQVSSGEEVKVGGELKGVNRPHVSITPAPMGANGGQGVQGRWGGMKRGSEYVEGGQKEVLKKAKVESTVVMPPSAKSILERREKAIREGRRKDAKLTEAERRILRRLRNRESAERCRLRRVQQAAQLEERIQSMQVENDRLSAMAEEYEKTIRRLEDVIAKYKAREGGELP